MKVSNWERIHKPPLVGTFDLAMPSGMVLYRCALFGRTGTNPKLWVVPSSTVSPERMASDGVAWYNAHVASRKVYGQPVGFTDTPTFIRWTEQVLVALSEAIPEIIKPAPKDPKPKRQKKIRSGLEKRFAGIDYEE